MKSPPLLPSLSPQRKRRLSSHLFVFSLVVVVFVLYSEDFSCILGSHFHYSRRAEQITRAGLLPPRDIIEEKEASVEAAAAAEEGCDIFAGEWVYDERSRPHYGEEECPYIQPQLTCQAHGRPDTGYQHWRWQPRACSLPSFNATLMLEKLRGKRMMFVGDSLNRGQFVSMVCLLHRVIPENAKSMESLGSLTVFRAKEYNASIEFYWAPFLVESNSDNAVVHRITDRIVRAGSIMKHARHWEGADVLVFNTYLWWMAGSKIKILRGSFEGDMKNITEMVTEDAYKIALRRTTKWVNKNMDPRTTRVFFVTMSPSHPSSKEWGGDPDGNCYNETRPITDAAYWGTGTSKSMMRVIGEVLGAARAPPVTLLNITQLSEYRKDAHTQIYKKQWNPLTPEQIANPRSYADCIHWCLPGLQDTWNELLYAKLFFPN
ncbi:hypothetical protein Cni_G25397 [Canna indica]|uniref:Trichome birefringence-like N-terminal domain-containing protein n=1 Tax=Canna indica TaxID=4628 RepID=A0AAQ3KXK9_9LILI|nr:hypothetical protein Cni_G25397 [Canna indica]